MKFGPVPLAQAQGAVLAHSLDLPGGLRLRKGARLLPEDLQALAAAGRAQVTVARLDPEDMDEDSAAQRIAQALVPDPAQAGLRLGAASTGRVNIYAEAPGITEVTAPRIHALNRVHPMITVATVPPWQRLDAGGMVATVKIIAYGVPQAAVAQASTAGAKALRLRRAVVRRADLIQTSVGRDLPWDKGQAVTAQRLARLGIEIGPQRVVPHDTAALAQAIAASQAEAVLILTGSATSDPADVGPQALRAAGGQVAHFGMPVDPGNLLFFGTHAGRPVIGLPGCARAPALNGADWVLERLLCGVEVTPDDIADMGVGGLLKEVPQRGRLRDAGAAAGTGAGPNAS